MVTLSSGPMANNLKHYIRLSGKTQIEVAKEKGCVPESISRHISGRSQFSVQDAVEYAAILNCTPEQLLFERKPMPILGDMRNGLACKFFSTDEPMRYIQTRSAPLPGYALMRSRWDNYSFQGDQYTMFDCSSMKTKTVPQTVHAMPALIKLKPGEKSLLSDGNTTFMSVVYPQPDGKFTLSGVYTADIVQGVELEWACPRIMVITRPDLWGWKEIDDPN